MLTHGAVEGFFAGVTEWRVAQVVHQGQCFDQIYIQSKLSRDGAGNLRYFDGVGQAIAEVVGIAASEYLGFGFETAEGAGVDDAVAIALKVVAIGMPGLRETASAGLFHAYGITGEHGQSLALLILEFCMVFPVRGSDLGLCGSGIVGCFLPRRGWMPFSRHSRGLRRGLYSAAALRLWA